MTPIAGRNGRPSGEIQGQCDNYLRKLDELHDDHVHTRMLWRSMQIRVQRHKKKLKVHNPITNNIVNGEALAARARNSVQRLKHRSFKDITAQFELFVEELLRLWLSNHPDLISEKALNVATLLASSNLAEAQEAAVKEAVEAAIIDRMYGRPEKWFNYLKKNLGAHFTAGQELLFTEMKARRDVLEHKNGIVDAAYRDKAKAAAKYDAGHRILLNDQDVDDAYKVTRSLIESVTASTIKKLATG